MFSWEIFFSVLAALFVLLLGIGFFTLVIVNAIGTASHGERITLLLTDILNETKALRLDLP